MAQTSGRVDTPIVGGYASRNREPVTGAMGLTLTIENETSLPDGGR